MTESEVRELFAPLNVVTIEPFGPWDQEAWCVRVASSGRAVGKFCCEKGLLDRIGGTGSPKERTSFYFDQPSWNGNVPKSWLPKAAKSVSDIIYDTVKKLLEDRMNQAGIVFKRKQGGLRCKLFASPEVYPSEQSIDIVMIGGTHGGTRDYSRLVVSYGDLADPGTNVEAAVDKVIEILSRFQEMAAIATKVEDSSF